MSDTGSGAGGAGTPAPTELSEAEAVAAIEGLLDERPRRRATQQTPPQPEAAATETGDEPAAEPEEVIGDDEDGQPPEPGEGEEPDEPDHPRIEPPNSWSAADKEVFKTLPAEAQAIVARRQSEMDKAFSQKTQEISDHRKAIEATLSEINTERQSYAQNLQQLLFVAAPEAQKFAQVDWQRLASEQPAEYVRLSAERDALRGRIGGIQAELQRVSQQQGQDQARQFAALRQTEQQRLVEALPDFGDAEKGPKLASDMRQWLQKQGFRDEEIGQVVDHRVILVAHRAMLADRAREARQAAEGKRTPPSPVAVQPPGSNRQRSDSAAAQRRQAKMNQLRKTGSEQDAISLLMDIL